MDEIRNKEENYSSEEIENNSENKLEDNDNTINLDKIKKERDFLNIFTLEASEYKKQLRKILLSEEGKDLDSIEDKILNINLDKKTMNKGNKKENKNKNKKKIKKKY